MLNGCLTVPKIHFDKMKVFPKKPHISLKTQKGTLMAVKTFYFLSIIHMEQKNLNQTVFFTKFAKQQIYIQAIGFHS